MPVLACSSCGRDIRLSKAPIHPREYYLCRHCTSYGKDNLPREAGGRPAMSTQAAEGACELLHDGDD